MSGKTTIEWTEQTWNPIVGCSIISPGCTNCYAMKMAARIEAMNAAVIDYSRVAGQYAGTTRKVNGNAVWTGKLAQAPESVLLAPLKRKKPTIYFVNSMGDLFHQDCPDDWIDKVFAVMALCPQHTFQVLTKRAGRMRDYFGKPTAIPNFTSSAQYRIACGVAMRGGASDDMPWPLPNVWLGVSTERQQEADERIPLLLQTPAAVRFISAEPLLGPVHLTKWLHDSDCDILEHGVAGVCTCSEPREVSLDWVIVGGESGPGARPMDPAWALSIRDQCMAAEVPFFFKQWGAFVPEVRGRYRRVSKKEATRLLDGVEHNGFPQVSA